MQRRSLVDRIIGRWPEKPHRFVSAKREGPASWRSAVPSLYTALYHKATGRVQGGLPWLPYAAIRFLDRTLTRSHQVLEIGGGASTVYFAQRAGHVTTLEADPEWRAQITRMLGAMIGPATCDMRAMELSEPLRDVSPGEYDVVLLDAPPREALVLPLLAGMRRGALLLVDNWDLPKFDVVRSAVTPERVLTDFAPYNFAVSSLAIFHADA